MLTRITALCICISCCCVKFTQAQIRSYGFKAGANYSSISNLSTIILSEPYFINYSISESGRYGWHFGFFYEYKLEGNLLGFQSEIMYSKQGGDVKFSNYEKDFHYKMEFAYQYANIVGLLKWFPKEGKVSLGAGPFLGINVATRNIKYSSWGTGKLDAFGTDLQQQQQLRNVLRGKNNFGVAIDLAWDINNAIKVGGRYYWSGTNAVETEANSYNFITVKNNNTVWEFSVALNCDYLFGEH
ncbi:MAG: outer membrane beta-barrel protein [Chitinophagaceae bacterium]